MTFGDLSNLLLKRLRQRGVNYGAQPLNVGTDFNPPYEIALALNTAYNQFLSEVKDYPIATLDVDFSTVAGAVSYSLNPVPPLIVGTGPGATIYPNAAVMTVYELRYTQMNVAYGQITDEAQERYIPSLSSTQFRQFTGAYTQRLGALSAYPRRVCQLYGQRTLSMFPGTATAGDKIKLFACPDPQATGRVTPAIACAQGGPMSAITDVPLMDDQYHMALLYFAATLLAENVDKIAQGQRDADRYAQLVENAKDFGAARLEGNAEQRVVDPYITAFDIDAAVL